MITNHVLVAGKEFPAPPDFFFVRVLVQLGGVCECIGIICHRFLRLVRLARGRGFRVPIEWRLSRMK